MNRTAIITAVAAEQEAIEAAFDVGGRVSVGPYRHCFQTPTTGGELLVVAGGIGPAAGAAAASTIQAIWQATCLFSMGIGGAFAPSGLSGGGIAVASQMVFGDLGAMSPEGFLDLAALGLEGGEPIICPEAMVQAAVGRIGAAGIPVATGPIVTVSTATGTRERAEWLTSRYSPVAEGMEGAGIGHVARLYGLPVMEIRAISNRVGIRDRAAWDIPSALKSLTLAIRSLFVASGNSESDLSDLLQISHHANQ